jgi:hypothetical protein
VVFGGKDEGGRIDGATKRISPVEGEIVMVAGESTSVSCGVVMTALVETRTMNGLFGSWGAGESNTVPLPLSGIADIRRVRNAKPENNGEADEPSVLSARFLCGV